MNKQKSLIVIGASGHAKEIIWLLESLKNQWTLRGILDDRFPDIQSCCGVPVLGSVDDATKFSNDYFIVAIGSTKIRHFVTQKLINILGNVQFATLMHPEVKYARSTEIGIGSVITIGSTLSAEVKIGNHCLINFQSTVAHESQLDDFCTLAPQVAISGNVILEKGVDIGTNASLKQGIRIGEGSVIGMGATVITSFPSHIMAAGCPATIKKELDSYKFSLTNKD